MQKYVDRMYHYMMKQMFGEMSNVFGLVENFEEDDNKTLNTFLNIMTIFGFILYFLVFLGLWVRVIYYAFQSGIGEGLSSIFFYNLYMMYFVGSVLSTRPNSKGMFSN